MVGSFHGVLIFITFMVDLTVMKISTHENECLYVYYQGEGHESATSSSLSASDRAIFTTAIYM